MHGGKPKHLLEHHLIWLEAHPNRTFEWFRERMADGFQVHHVDGDHSNNHPSNLVLIETIDHMRLHGLFRLKTVKIKLKEIQAKGRRSRWEGMTPKQRAKWARDMVKLREKKRRKAAHKMRKVADG